MTTAINLDSVPKVRNAAKNKPDKGTIWYSHDGDKYPCLYLGVGKRAASWYFKGRLNGRSQQKALKATFPETTAAQAFEKIATLTEYHTGVASSDIRTVRDAWEHHCTTRQSEGKMSDRHRNDMTTKLDRWVPEIMDASPTDVSTIMIQSAVNAIDTGRGDNSAATKRHVRVALSSAFKRLPGKNPVENVTVPDANEQPPIWYDLCDDNRDLEREDLSTVWGAIWEKRQQNVIMGTAWVVMFFTGIRSENVCSLRWERDGRHGFVDLQRRELVFPKLKSGIRNHVIPIGASVAEALQAIRLTDSDWVFPASSATGYVGGGHGLDTLKAKIGEKRVPVIRAKDTRKFFQEACNEALLGDHIMHYLRGDKSSSGDGKMLSKYTTRVGKSAPDMIETVFFERIKVEPAFDIE
ncbi:tyrosine-type recombinase/integrase [Ponticoccus alexandrii]|uniref:Tyr recombinase domain-containing protein n=1 Tax=Ponticoccus alexandrii TaxID=1943633 RepID=A0ABX7F9P0_9RHOB|nr:integrase family protein [Ponticoccus alexandrii]ETA53846.1 hypothetical protein P279_00975 [Rhodobacteraceae bacterium PD-2]QRF67260.1 hypothetical protein GQA70_13655 [Ponticoccus alexandrii]